ncbi:LacI family DNA-binding transcriptional regulator [Tersicoccus sp. Bi-70]|uniref:LacI family DNA-binding transcriptional regulator n=1 Tax=Tersicoccus sp. Bi-70 TaxID=1897634 RepID=UPI0009759383|nr:LacI family DNA-binding transcriptional regulator [Tersicoccus sp. Bi-70]OMH31474.1 LacI family transcriptional regulator [Tersicoccus sp. Bi-70]
MGVTIADVARAAGVSKGAVSYALNNRPGVSEATRSRILAHARELGFKPNAQARSLSSSRAFAIGLVIARDPALLGSDPFFPGFIAGLETVLADEDVTLVLTVATRPGAEERAYRRLADGGRVDGFVLSDLRCADNRIALLRETGLPVVTLNRPDTDSPFPAVLVDDTAGVRNAVEHLIGLGHRRIGHVAGPQDLIHGRSRFRAWRDTMTEHGLDADLVAFTDFGAGSGVAGTEELLARTDPPTALVYANDVMAIAGMSAIAAGGRSVPGDVSVVGYDDAPIAGHLNPGLTTVATSPVHWGELTARVLLRAIEHGPHLPDVTMAPPALVVRGSTAPPPARRRPASSTTTRHRSASSTVRE